MSANPPVPLATLADVNNVRRFVAEHRDQLLADLDAWLRIPGISAQPEHAPDVQHSAEWFADACRVVGFPTVEVWPTAGCPTVFAQWPADNPDAPVILVYGHHDVQPVDPLALWLTDPFDPTLDGDLLRARGASDDKGQLLFHLLGLRAHLAETGGRAPAVTLKLLIEGEEESGSPNFSALLASRRDRLDCDVIVVTDTGMLAETTPSTVTGMRGLVSCTLNFHGPDLDLHSGVFGGAIPNPATALARLLAALHDDQGRVQVPGFYEKVQELSATEADLVARVPFDESEFLRTAQSRSTSGETGYSTLQRLGARPTAEVNGLGGGYQGAGGKTIVPSDAFAKLSFRLVSDQQPEAIRAAVSAFVQTHTPDGIVASVDWEGDGVSPCLVDIQTPAYQALTRAIGAAFDTDVVLPTREGGSGPEAALVAALGAPLVFLGVGLPDDQIHAPNEKVSVAMLLRGAEAAAHLWQEFSVLGRAGLNDGALRPASSAAAD